MHVATMTDTLKKDNLLKYNLTEYYHNNYVKFAIYLAHVYVHAHIHTVQTYKPPLAHLEQCNKASGRPFKLDVL